MSTENQEPKKSDAEDDKSDDSSRSPGVTDRDPNSAKNTSKGNDTKEGESQTKS